MRKSLKVAAALAAALLVVGGAAVGVIYRAARHVPDFYQAEVDRDLESQRSSRDALVAEVTGLASDLHGGQPWKRLFTADQINAWLALELGNEYPDFVDGGLRDPRLSIGDEEATIACRWDDGPMAVVLSLTVDVSVAEPNVLAVRIRRARAGALPVPLARVLDAISRAAGDLKLRLAWRRSHGDPVALVTLGPTDGSSARAAGLQTIELHDGVIFVAGGGRRSLVQSDVVESGPSDSVDELHPLVGAAPKETRQE